MQLTKVLCRQHIARHFKKHWYIQGKKSVVQSNVNEILTEHKIPIYNPDDILAEKRPDFKFEDPGLAPKPVSLDSTHPNWNDRPCYTFNDTNVLVEGLAQAQVITKTAILNERFPSIENAPSHWQELDGKVKRIILASQLFDAEQKKLPIFKDPERPAWNFPRTYGITEERKNKLLIAKLLQLIETHGDLKTVEQRSLLNKLQFIFPFEKEGNLLQFTLTGDTFITSANPLKPISTESTLNLEIPDLNPIGELLSINTENIYQIQNIYPIRDIIKKRHPHTLFVHYNGNEVRNLFGEIVTEDQVNSRALLKAFTAAASFAKETYGETIQDLPTPVTIQCVQTDGRLFNFGIFQLNTLNLEGSQGVKNIWSQCPHLPLYEQCAYKSGRPTLDGYNSEIIKLLSLFYHNM